jgi:transcriptional regulator with GAF, ATPase, and Fis domain
VAVNCSALPASLAESELFGHEKGSFTGAQALRKGRFELAHGGTLFLDEIGDLPLEIQPTILRALQEGRFERVGGESPVSVDVRIVAATHVDLAAAVEAGTFREDLFYRVAVFPVRMPPLRERGQDSILIAELFAARLRTRPGWQDLAFSADALDLIARRDWPGNVRELRNAVERAAILAKGGIIGAQELCAGDWAQGRSPGTGSRTATSACPDPARDPDASGTPTTLREAEREHVRAALARARGRIYGPDGAAAALGLPPSTLQSRLKKLGLEPKAYR